MIILGIETSCDETATAVLKQDKDGIQILSNVVASSASLQAKYGGIIPEQAAREQIKSIIPVIEEALNQAFPNVIPAKAGIQKKDYLWIPDQVRDDKGRIPPIDNIAVTYGPGLIGSLLVGVETAKILATIWNKPLVPINHLIGHFYANWISPSSLRGATATKQSSPYSNGKIATGPLDPRNDVPRFPCLGLLVSGGHTDLVLFTNHNKYTYLGGTRDDAAGECFDKCARLLGLPYPGGPQISKLAEKGNPDKFKLPLPMKGHKDFDFSYSGLKTAVANIVNSGQVTGDSKADLAAAIEETIIISLIDKTIQAAQRYNVEQIMVTGGVAANQKLVHRLQVTVNSINPKIKLHIPPPSLCTDNAAMIAAAAFFQKQTIDPLNLQADPNLSLEIYPS